MRKKIATRVFLIVNFPFALVPENGVKTESTLFSYAEIKNWLTIHYHAKNW